jgi:Flp pilus assembly protein TadB
MFLSFVVVSVFSFVSVAVWSGTREQERKNFHRSETLKKLAESGSAAVVEYLREEERQEERRRLEQAARVREGNRVGGLILIVVGAAVAVAFHQIVREVPIYLFGLIPFGIGLVLFTVSFTGRGRS